MDRFADLSEKVLPLLRPLARRVSVFGSFARGEDTVESDVDLLVDFEQPRARPLGLMGWVRLERELTRRVGRRVEIVSEASLNRHVRPYVEADLVTLYEKAR